jgi:hypothetical protein
MALDGQQTRVPPVFTTIDIPLPSSKVLVALVQLDGPLPLGKDTIAWRGRDTYRWKSMEAIKLRQDKALAIVDHLAATHQKSMLVIFPEYSVALDPETCALLQAAASRNMQIIVAGGDNMRIGDGNIVHARSAIFIPGGEEPQWVTKRTLSKWEERFIDAPPGEITNPILTWKAEGRRCWIVVSLCLDFVARVLEDQARLPYPAEPVLYAVPMCSPTHEEFYMYADSILSRDGGRAILLANCVGVDACGRSAIFAVTPAGQRGQPALRCPDSGECVLVVELDCANLAPPKRTLVNGPPGALGRPSELVNESETLPIRI